MIKKGALLRLVGVVLLRLKTHHLSLQSRLHHQI